MAAATAATVCPSLPRASPWSQRRHPGVRATAFSLQWAAPSRRRPSVISVQWSCNGNRQSHQHRIPKRTGETYCSQTELIDSADDDEACELVSGADLVIGEGDDSIDAYLLKAVKNNNGTGILLLSDIFGFEDSATRDFAYRVACHGYNVLVPDLFRGSPWKEGLPMEGLDQWLAGLPAKRVAGDIDTSTKWLVDGFTAAGMSKKLGVLGFCYGGGRLVETLARDADACFSAGVCFYGTGMDASLGSRITAPVLLVLGNSDPLCPVSTVRELERRAPGAKAVVYGGRGHGFAHRPQSQEEDGDAEDAFAAMKSWFHDHLLV